ncbi:uncharacterized protein FIBRA_08935 [Fibroporia radiculosa]|uniref:F-box domain-containing protein n=1 Tax=Fibroporia radiculosa TaxID=599839 RepID=J4I3J7_9APHY|nr:uncharacterized protein FIBRA_08935 [Fibroporia radiculosa]CCM06652.1 predicted protein [Fibroporia radiculosa]
MPLSKAPGDVSRRLEYSVAPEAISSANAVYQARKNLEDEIADNLRVVARLRSRLNTLTPIARLPPELLAAIFAHYIAQFPKTASTHYYKWLQVTHVCSRWRHAALAFPTLWAHIVLPADPECVDEMLLRSGAAPLSVSASYSRMRWSQSTEDPECLALTMHHLSRIQHLWLSAPPHILELLWDESDDPASLESLMLISDTFPFDPVHGPASQRLTIPILFPVSRAPRLRSLAVHNYPICWDTLSSLSSLRHLKIRNNKRDHGPIFMSKLISELEKIPALESLALDTIFRTDEEATGRILALSHLQSLELAGDMSRCVDFLNHLTLPSNIRLVIRCDGNDVQALSRALAAKVSQPKRKPLKSLYVYELGGDFHLHAYEHDHRQLFASLRSPRSLFDVEAPIFDDAESTLSIVCAGRGIHITAILLAMCKALPLANAQSLFVSGEMMAHERMWLETFGKMKNLSALWVHEDAGTVSLSKALLRRQTRPHGISKDRPESYYFPHLRLLKLHGLRFRTVDEYWGDEYGAFALSLLDCLTDRAKHGAKISKLILKTCINMEKDDVEYLRKHVGSVIWDHVEDYDDRVEEDDVVDEDEDDDEDNDQDDDIHD